MDYLKNEQRRPRITEGNPENMNWRKDVGGGETKLHTPSGKKLGDSYVGCLTRSLSADVTNIETYTGVPTSNVGVRRCVSRSGLY